MSANPAAPTLDDLLKKLQDLKPGSSPQEALALLRSPQSDALEHAKRQAALVCVLDVDVYAFLLGANDATPPSPTFDELLDAFPNDFQSIDSARARVSPSTNTRMPACALAICRMIATVPI